MIKLRNILFILITTSILLIISKEKIQGWYECTDISELKCYYGYGDCTDTCCEGGTKLYQCTCTSAYRIECSPVGYVPDCSGPGFQCSTSSAGDYCYGTKLGNCCTPGPCVGCTPTCPTGYSSTPNSCSTTTASCRGSNGCSSCTRTITCYLNESNIAPDMPTSISMIVDGSSYELSSSPSAPTRIKYPSASPSVQVSVPTISVPPTSGGVGYRFLADNYGVNDEWEGWINCNGEVGEDFCIQDTLNAQDFDPSSLTVLQVLKENSEGKISGLNYTNNNCDTDVKYSLPKEGYYSVDRIPDVTDGNGNPPTKASTLPGYASDMTVDGCSSSTYTGKDINNPLHINIRASDPDGISEIEAGIIWFSKDASIPNLVSITTNDTLSNTNDFGVMFRKNGDWSNPLVYTTNENTEWKLLTESDKISIVDRTITQGTEILFDFKIVFEDSASNPSGSYNLYVGAVDSYMITNNVVDQSRLFDVTNWGIDLSDPTVGDITQNVEDIQNILLSWNVTDLESNITDIVINGYRSGGDATAFVELFIPPPPYVVSKGAFIPPPIPADDQIGILSDLSSAWHFTNSAMSRVETDKVTVGENEGGNINLYVTGYDEGCNKHSTFENIDLNPWVTSYGGTVYSTGGIINAAKDVSDVDALDGVFQNLTKENLDTGTETISSRASNITNLVKNLGVTAPNIYDTNDRKTYWYDHFTEKLSNEKVESAQNFTENWSNTDMNVSSNCTSDVCYYKGEGDISIKSGFVCDKKTLFMTEGNITVSPDITTSSTSTGCIFFAKEDIHVAAGGYKSAAFSTTQYDYFDGYLIAQRRIIFDLVDTGASIRDGIEIKGGIVAFGDGVSGASAINILRNLKLFSQTSPTVVLVYDPRYPIISSQFFGTEAPIYKQEVGFKNF